jgi:hypothetical protein
VTIARARALLAAVVLVAVAGCSAGDGPSREAGAGATTASSTTASSTTTSSTTTEAEPVVPDDAVWILGDPDLTFVRTDPVDSLPLGAYDDDRAPVVAGTHLVIEYRTTEGGAVYVEQADLVDPDLTLRDSVREGEAGFPSTLTTIAGSSRVVISGPT